MLGQMVPHPPGDAHPSAKAQITPEEATNESSQALPFSPFSWTHR